MTTLVLCVDRTDEVGRKTGTDTPIVGAGPVRELVLDLGVADPEDSGVNALLATLRTAKDLNADGHDALPVVVAGVGDSMVGADRSIAEQIDALQETHAPDSAVIVIDSAQDERVVPIVESRMRVDSVDRVVVRQARDIESTYYLLKQFLADEELRQTVLVPIGLTLVVFPALSLVAGTAVALATITAVIGVFLLYKGVGVEDYVTRLHRWVRRSLYSGQVSLVTYVVAAGLLLIGVVAGALSATTLEGTPGELIVLMQFVFDSVLWAVAAGIVAATGRLLDQLIQEEQLHPTYLNLPFVILSVGLVLRGFSGYLLSSADLLEPVVTPMMDYGVFSIDPIEIGHGERLVGFVMGAIAITLAGVKVAAFINRRSRWIDAFAEGDAG